mmetsp:Transcript_30233/g.115938  ORF Transcript_30233/g.115938 Transcript_30233/m.115938 type:complete len:117 (-) Transcript_30233:783-1133(-)
MCVARNVVIKPTLVCGGGAIEMAISHALMEKSKSIEGVVQQPYQAVAQALEVIPRTLVVSSSLRKLLKLDRSKAAGANASDISDWTYEGKLRSERRESYDCASGEAREWRKHNFRS